MCLRRGGGQDDLLEDLGARRGGGVQKAMLNPDKSYILPHLRHSRPFVPPLGHSGRGWEEVGSPVVGMLEAKQGEQSLC